MVRAPTCIALLTFGWTFVYGMGITVAVGGGSKGISMDG